MLLKTLSTLSHSSTISLLLLALFLTNRISIGSGSLAARVKILRNGHTTYPETTTPRGTVRGINMLTHYNRTVAGFLGVPYAQPPIGDLRFKAPLPPNAWNGTLNATTEVQACPQFDDQGQISGDEDCLYLNVFTPQLPENESSTLLPVMVFSVGGWYKTGNNSLVQYGPDFLLEKDVVLVVPNLRLGVLGFLSTGDEVSPGNYGLKDMVQVLKWVQDSIESFGGDPNSVTFFGASSGASTVHILALSDSTDGLIHRYITQSGTAITYISNGPGEVHAKRAVQLGEYLGCPTNTSTLLVNCLRNRNVSELLDTDSIFYGWQKFPNNVWVPTTEPDIEGALLIDSPGNLFAAGKIRDLPWISSVNRGEGLGATTRFYLNPDLFEDFVNDIDAALPFVVGYADAVDDPTAYTAALKAYYLNDLTVNRGLLMDNLTDLVGDALFVYPAYKTFQQQLASAKNPQYLGSFEYLGTFSYGYYFSGGTQHMGSEYSENDLIMVDTAVQLWTSFAANGTPTMADSDKTHIWKPYSSLNNYLQIGNGSGTALEMKYDLYIERMRFWDELTATTRSGALRNRVQVLSIALGLCAFLSIV